MGQEVQEELQGKELVTEEEGGKIRSMATDNRERLRNHGGCPESSLVSNEGLC